LRDAARHGWMRHAVAGDDPADAGDAKDGEAFARRALAITRAALGEAQPDTTAGLGAQGHYA